ncbi:SpoIIE family protein phosphatase [Streptomyces antimycoticus]|uniref:SpoIIE family protein phosphatase n=1 Tax=Streptomyces antimycoticus TaxID=68175 RepID=UPI0036B280EB
MVEYWARRNDPMARARERFASGDLVEEGVRAPILQSWQRCRDLGLRPDRFELPYDANLDLESPLVRAALPVLDHVEATFLDTQVSLIITDGDGTVLVRRTGDRSLDQLLDDIQLLPGFRYAERLAGTCGLGTALAERRLHHVRGSEHFAECLQAFACFAAPVLNPLSGRIDGAVNLTCRASDARPMMETFIQKARNSIERQILDTCSQRERAVLQAYLQAKRRGCTAVAVTGDGLEGVDALGDSGLSRRDQGILREKATELLSFGVVATAEVILSTGRTAMLLCRPVTTPSGISGAAVEALLPPASGHSTRLPPLAEQESAEPALWSPQRPGPEPAGTPKTSEAAETPGPGRGEAGHLLLVGEPTVGRFAMQTRRRLQLLSEGGVRIGTTLDIARTAAELADVAVPQLADFVTVDLLQSVLSWEEAAKAGGPLRRMAVGSIRADCPFYHLDTQFEFVPATPQGRCLTTGQSILEPDLTLAPGWLAQDPVRGEKLLVGQGIHSLMTVPLRSSGTVLGLVTFYRSEKPDPFENDDLSLAEELVAHAAVCIDNARRYTREHAMAVALQRSLLPQGLPQQGAVEAAYRYLPALEGVSGDWFDVIPLSGARVALVVGDVVGHGIQAAATMGRLRTAIHNFAALDLPPDELLTQLDDLVIRLDNDALTSGGGHGITGSSCLYAIYDPSSGQCRMARAGHPPPALVTPDGHVTLAELPPGPPLGLGWLPFQVAERELPTGSQLVLYSDGLLQDHRRDIDAGVERLSQALAHPQRPPEATCQAVMDAMLPIRPQDDVTLLVARTRRLDTRQIAAWELPSAPEIVSTTRTAVTRQLADWDLEELQFTTELILSELITNAIRYATGPLRVRMLRADSLICEVSDASSTSPHLRHAATTDEGGRGLFLVAQLAQRWGTRYTANGKIIWAEQDIPS